jgi:hypothetical protein
MLPVGVHVIQAFYSGAPGFAASSGFAAAAVATAPPTGSGMTIAPQDGALKLTPVTFRAASSVPSIASARTGGTRVTYTDTQPATTIFSVIRRTSGIERGGHCITPPRHRTKHSKRCTRRVTVGRFQHQDVAGANAFRFTGWLAGHKLKPGRYELHATPTNNTHQVGSQRRTDFRIIP